MELRFQKSEVRVQESRKELGVMSFVIHGSVEHSHDLEGISFCLEKNDMLALSRKLATGEKIVAAPADLGAS